MVTATLGAVAAPHALHTVLHKDVDGPEEIAHVRTPTAARSRA